MIWAILKTPSESPVLSLTLTFLAWRTILFAVALLSPGPGYDTSTSLLFDAVKTAHGLDAQTTSKSWPASLADRLARKLVRWDAIYFATTSQRGYLYEQEYAFGMGLTSTVSFLTSLLPTTGDPLITHAMVAIILSTAAHYLSTLVLYQLTISILKPAFASPATFTTGNPRHTAFLASTLHILAPAGLFLSAPYAESLFALLNFSGMWAYTASAHSHHHNHYHYILLILTAGMLFGAAATVRSNGIFSGAIFAYDAMALLLTKGPIRLFTSPASLLRAATLVLAGLCVAAGFAAPQVLAHRRFCSSGVEVGQRRPWCNAIPPSIYTFVQDRYWNVGFLRYWTVSNIPLFLLATPMLLALLVSSWRALHGTLTSAANTSSLRAKKIIATHNPSHGLLRRLALPQAILAVSALLVFHVQVVTRVASGYPVVYVWGAECIMGSDSSDGDARRTGGEEGVRGSNDTKKRWDVGELIVRGSVIYAVVQGALFAGFMPPA